jgi:hypothetical protein
MTGNADGICDTRNLYREALVPLLAFGSTILGIFLYQAGILVEIQYAGIGGFLASCLLAVLAWLRPRKDIVSLTTPIYGFIFLITPIDYTGGVVLQLLYACGLTVLVTRLHSRFGAVSPGRSSATELAAGPLKTYVGSAPEPFKRLDVQTGHSAAAVFVSFSEGDYQKAADLAHAASCHSGTPGPVVRAFGIVREHAELLETDQLRPENFLTFLPEDAVLTAKSLTGTGDADRVFETTIDNALLLLFGAAYHASPADRPLLISSHAFAEKLLEA